ncbi:hypothetical protein KC347_g4474 [Hortaea werneckii]|nr:hypothetical protein KC347_g4474 [Hortaea werneckii]
MSNSSGINNFVNMQIRGEYPAEPPPAYEDVRHHPSTRDVDLPPNGVISGASNASETSSTERNGLLGELLDRFSEPDRDSQQGPEQSNPPPIGDHKIQTDVSPPTSAPVPFNPGPSSESIPQQDRKRCMNTGSKPLSGTFPLYDSLSLVTHSGSLVATVIPHRANPLKPKPAELKVHSHSGSIRLETQIPDANEAAERDEKVFQQTYRTAVSSHSSRIDARVVVGEKTVVQSHSGTLGVEMVLPWLSLMGGGGGGEEEEQGEEGKGKKPQTRRPESSVTQLSLHTQTHSSSQEVRVVALRPLPSLPRDEFMASLPQHQHQQQQQQQILTSYHHTHSGKLRLHYPSTWTGRIEGTIGKPSAPQISIRGTGVDVIQQTPHRFLAKKRNSNSSSVDGQDGEGGMMANTLRFYSFSGQVEISFD